eukprot:955813_1
MEFIMIGVCDLPHHFVEPLTVGIPSLAGVTFDIQRFLLNISAQDKTTSDRITKPDSVSMLTDLQFQATALVHQFSVLDPHFSGVMIRIALAVVCTDKMKISSRLVELTRLLSDVASFIKKATLRTSCEVSTSPKEPSSEFITSEEFQNPPDHNVISPNNISSSNGVITPNHLNSATSKDVSNLINGVSTPTNGFQLPSKGSENSTKTKTIKSNGDSDLTVPNVVSKRQNVIPTHPNSGHALPNVVSKHSNIAQYSENGISNSQHSIQTPKNDTHNSPSAMLIDPNAMQGRSNGISNHPKRFPSNSLYRTTAGNGIPHLPTTQLSPNIVPTPVSITSDNMENCSNGSLGDSNGISNCTNSLVNPSDNVPTSSSSQNGTSAHLNGM